MKIGIIVQRYGLSINGGAELHARQLAEKLGKNHQVEVFTTRSDSYITWQNKFPEGKEMINRIPVRRFTSAPKDIYKADKLYRKMRNLSKISIFLRKIKLRQLALNDKLVFPNTFNSWLKAQGPYCPGMTAHIDKVKSQFDVFIVFTYLYYPANSILPLIKEKSIFIPTAHDEKTFYFPGYKKTFESASFIMYNSAAEKRLVEKTYPVSRKKNSAVAGAGIKKVDFKPGKSPLDIPYFVYIGRLDLSKNVPELIEQFKKATKNRDVKLVLIGRQDSIRIEPHPKIILTGYISEEEKYNWLVHSRGLIMPSKKESLSLVTLEAMQAGVPVIVNAKSEVLLDHIQASGAGFAYKNGRELKKVIDYLLKISPEKRQKIGEKGKKYVRAHFRWESILEKYEQAFEVITQKNNKK